MLGCTLSAGALAAAESIFSKEKDKKQTVVGKLGFKGKNKDIFCATAVASFFLGMTSVGICTLTLWWIAIMPQSTMRYFCRKNFLYVKLIPFTTAAAQFLNGIMLSVGLDEFVEKPY